MMNIVGYFVDKDGDKNKATDVFVCIVIREDSKFEYYCPVGQHGEGYISYLAECNPITKEQYLKASEGLYTPSDYVGIRLSEDTWRNIFRNLNDMTSDEYYDGVVDWVEVIYLDNLENPSEYGLAFGEELFEDGFSSEKEAQERLNYLEKNLL